MPSKGKRVAVSQSNQRRRRRAPNRPATPPIGSASASAPGAATATANAPSSATATATATPPAASPTAGTATAARSTSPQAPPASQPRGRRFERPAAYNYVGSELARIGIFSAVLLAALIAISFVI